NKPEGKRYAAAFSRWISDAKLNNIIGGEDHKALRCRLLDLMDHIDDVEEWRATLSPKRRLEWNYPLTIYKHWQKSKIPINSAPVDKPRSHVAKLNAALAASQEELNRLKEANGGNQFTAKDRPADVVKILTSTFTSSKLVEMRRLL